jgi:DNA-binding GntR family transcriptional regulator
MVTPHTQTDDTEIAERPSNTERAYRELRRRIIENEMPAGHQALEQELADALGMSRTPVREAMIRLANEGLVEIRPRHGMRVLPISAQDMAEIYAVLTALEATAAEEVARRGLSEGELASLTKAVSDMDAALKRDDLRAWAEADERFHKRLVAASGNQRLQSIVEMYWDQAHRVRLLTLQLRPRPARSNEDHAAVVEAIIAGDAERAREIHREHRLKSGRMLIDLLQRFGFRQL